MRSRIRPHYNYSYSKYRYYTHIGIQVTFYDIGAILYTKIYDKNTIFYFIEMVILLHHSLVRANCIIFSYIGKKSSTRAQYYIVQSSLNKTRFDIRSLAVHGWLVPIRLQKFGEYSILTIYI